VAKISLTSGSFRHLFAIGFPQINELVDEPIVALSRCTVLIELGLGAGFYAYRGSFAG
jgi:hypothetical protein